MWESGLHNIIKTVSNTSGTEARSYSLILGEMLLSWQLLWLVFSLSCFQVAWLICS